MVDDRALKMTCGACGAANEIDLPSVSEAAKSEAEKLTDSEMASRYREAFKRMVAAALPPSLQRLPLARISTMGDGEALSVGRDVLTLMLSPTG